jgi:hypothetical protein
MLQLNHLILVVLLSVLSLSDSPLEALVDLKKLLILLYRLFVLLVDLLEPLLEQLQFLSMLQIQLVILVLQSGHSLIGRGCGLGGMELLGKLTDPLVLRLELKKQLFFVPLALLLILDHPLHVRYLLDHEALGLLGFLGLVVQ